MQSYFPSQIFSGFTHRPSPHWNIPARHRTITGEYRRTLTITLIPAIQAVKLSITNIPSRDTATIRAAVAGGSTHCTSRVFIRPVHAILLSITFLSCLNALAIPTCELHGCAAPQLILPPWTLGLAITSPGTTTTTTCHLAGTAGSWGCRTVELILPPRTVTNTITYGPIVQTCPVTTCQLITTTLGTPNLIFS